MTQDELKQAVARTAFEYVESLLENDTVIGVGTGSTANLFIAELGKIQHKVYATVASSEESARRLKELNIPVLDLIVLELCVSMLMAPTRPMNTYNLSKGEGPR